LQHKLTQYVTVLLLSYLFFQYGIPALSLAITGRAAPVPAHLLWTIYMPTVALVMLLFVSADEASWREFKAPLRTLLVERERSAVVALRIVLAVALPLLAGVLAYFQVRPSVRPPAELRSVHPADPGTITVGGEQFELQGLANPLRGPDGSVSEADLEAGRDIYITHCVFCHGDALNGDGMFADGLQPRPADFTDSGTIAQLSESYVFWRVAKGGPGLPPEGTPWNSAMPAWEDELTAEEIWQVIAYIYEAAGPNIFPAERAAAPANVALAGVGLTDTASPAAQESSRGQQIYEERCAACHGINGDGQGPAAERLAVRPRDFTRDEYEIKSTAGDEFPSRQDLIDTIATGMPGSSMPGWRGVLSEREMGAVADYLQTFGRFFEQEGYGTTSVDVPGRVNPSDESIERGRVLYHDEIECVRCHGPSGRGDGPSAFELTDNEGNVIYPADLAQPWRFRGGMEPEDIFLRIHTGMLGTPMPAFGDAVSAEDIWHMVNYILSLAPEEAPDPALLLAGEYVEGSLPSRVDDPIWDELEPAYYPLSGQIMRAPRHYRPSIANVTARALHNGSEVALLLTWNDRTESRQGEAVDAVAIQFPQELGDDSEQPYFVFGEARRAVYQWYWTAAADEVLERTANGLDAITDQPESRWQTTAASRFQDGQWRVLFRRSLQSADSDDLSLQTDRFIPIAFMVWDGHADESGPRMGLTTWSELYLPSPTPLIEYVWIPVVMLGVVAAEALVTWRVRLAARTRRTD
jgi:DMSO reductase family type II enzyme heme b subunit